VEGGVEAPARVALLQHRELFRGEVVLEVGEQRRDLAPEIEQAGLVLLGEQELVRHVEQRFELSVDVWVACSRGGGDFESVHDPPGARRSFPNPTAPRFLPADSLSADRPGGFSRHGRASCGPGRFALSVRGLTP